MSFSNWGLRDIIRVLVVILALMVLLLGLGITPKRLTQRDLSTPTAATTPSPTPPPTSTPTPTLTPTPTQTLILAPTSTFTPTPIPTSAFVAHVPISFRNEFDNTDLIRGDWNFFPTVRVENGLMIVQGSDDWDGAYGNLHLNDDQTVLIQFRYSPGSDIHIAVETGEWQTPSYKAWGVGSEDNIFTPAITEGTTELGGWLQGNLRYGPDHWYVAMLYIGGANDFAARLWDYEDPSKFLEVQHRMGNAWAGLTWSPVIAVGPGGMLEVERYEELEGRPEF
jgi:hypothetical protein